MDEVEEKEELHKDLGILYGRLLKMAFSKQLYEYSVLALEPQELSEKITPIIQNGLECEFVGLMLYDQETHDLTPLSFSESKDFRSVREKVSPTFPSLIIKSAPDQVFFKHVFENKSEPGTEQLTDIWGPALGGEGLKKLEQEAKLKSILARPLLVGSKIIGMLVFGFSQTYNSFPPEKIESIADSVSLITLALDKALVYKQLNISNELKSLFLGAAAHNIKNPIVGMRNEASLVLEGDYGEVNDKVSKMAKNIITQADDVFTRLDQYLNVSKIELGQMEYKSDVFDLRATVDGIVNNFQTEAKHKSLVLEFSTDDKDYTIKADKGKIKEVVENLINNAIKYTDRGLVNVSVAKLNDKFQITVADSGQGITPETIPLLFNEFKRGTDKRTKKIKGTGLGLYLSRLLITPQKGRIWAESAGQDKGSKFYVELPATL